LAIGLPLFAALCYFVGKALYADFQNIHWADVRISWLALAAALASLVLARFMNGLNCRALLASLDQHAPLARITAIIWLASLGRYIPGKMAVVAGAALMLSRIGVRMPAALAALFLSTALMIITSLLTCLPLLLTPHLRQAMPGGWLLGLAILLIGLIGLHPRVFTKLCNLALIRLKRQPLPARLATATLMHAVGISFLRSLFLAVGLYFTSRAIADVGIADFPLVLGSAALASVAGFLAVFAPAGLGVHEGIYLLTLSPLLGPAAALLAILFRILHILADLLTAATAVLIIARRTDAAVAHTAG
jgi:hypothetical protein